jgi:indole-3-glycerol phosphate synthase
LITLAEIKNEVQRQLERRKRIKPLEKLLAGAQKRAARDLSTCFPANRINIIAEIKRASPSEGLMAPCVDPATLATAYLDHGAAGLSILTEEVFFKGSTQFICQVRDRFPSAFILMKDFILDEYQIFEGLAAGADAVLLILALIGKDKAEFLMARAADYGMHALIEVHDDKEMELAASLNAPFIGVNNRNLNTMQVDVTTSETLAVLAPKNGVLISESGLTHGHQLRHLSGLGYRGFLIGTHLMKSPDPGEALARLVSSAHADQN